MGKSLKERKERLKEVWESCFNKKMEDKLTEDGIKFFWDDNTTLSEAAELLTGAAVNDVIDDVLCNLAGVIVVKEQDTEKETDFKVHCSRGNFFFDETFDSIDEAKEFIKDKAMNCSYTVNDFKVVKVYD